MAEQKATSAHTEHVRAGTTAHSRRSSRTHSPRSCSGSLISFVALYLLMSRIALPRIGSDLRASARSASRAISPRRSASRRSPRPRIAAYEKALADARSRAQAIGDEIRDKVHAEAEEKRKALEAKLNAQLAEAEKIDRRDQDRRDGATCAASRRRPAARSSSG